MRGAHPVWRAWGHGWRYGWDGRRHGWNGRRHGWNGRRRRHGRGRRSWRWQRPKLVRRRPQRQGGHVGGRHAGRWAQDAHWRAGRRARRVLRELFGGVVSCGAGGEQRGEKNQKRLTIPPSHTQNTQQKHRPPGAATASSSQTSTARSVRPSLASCASSPSTAMGLGHRSAPRAACAATRRSRRGCLLRQALEAAGSTTQGSAAPRRSASGRRRSCRRAQTP